MPRDDPAATDEPETDVDGRDPEPVHVHSALIEGAVSRGASFAQEGEEHVDTAAGLTSRAVTGEVLVDKATQAAASEFSFAGADTTMLKGRGQPVETYRLALDAPIPIGEDPLAVLLRTPLFAGLPSKLATALRQRVHRRSFEVGAYLAREGEGATSLFVLPVIAKGVGTRLGFLAACAAVHVAISRAFYFDFLWARPNALDAWWGAALGW